MSLLKMMTSCSHNDLLFNLLKVITINGKVY